MYYQKPTVIATQTVATGSYAAGCPEKTSQSSGCSTVNRKCECGPLK